MMGLEVNQLPAFFYSENHSAFPLLGMSKKAIRHPVQKVIGLLVQKVLRHDNSGLGLGSRTRAKRTPPVALLWCSTTGGVFFREASGYLMPTRASIAFSCACMLGEAAATKAAACSKPPIRLRAKEM